MENMALLELNEAVETILRAMEPVLEEASVLDWHSRDGAMPLVQRAVLRRQYDGLESISYLVKNGRGFAAVPLLRPSCEEYIWIKYLHGIGTVQANSLLSCVVGDELYLSLQAQDDFAGRTVTKKLNLLDHLHRTSADRELVQAGLRELGRALGWDSHTIEHAQLPNLRFLAKQTDTVKFYNFMYHATSRFVHFSGIELLRRVWGEPGHVTIASGHFAEYWSAFALKWGFRILTDTLLELKDHLVTDTGKEMALDDATIRKALDTIQMFGDVPIVTPDELQWPE